MNAKVNLADCKSVEAVLALLTAGAVDAVAAGQRIKALTASAGVTTVAEVDDKGKLVIRLPLDGQKESSTGKSIVLGSASGKATLPDGRAIRYSASVYSVK